LIARLAALLLMAVGAAQAYYHFIRYADREGQRIALVQKFDLSALPVKTIRYYIADPGPERLAANDSLSSLLSQIRLAARQWDEVESSELRVRYGGRIDPGSLPEDTPAIEVLFDELPPGLLALGGPVTVADPPAGAAFLPIQRSQIVLPNDFTSFPSFAESTYLTMVHEFGHALGLQHTLTSSVMATQLTRAVTKGQALAADDIAGVSILYPTRTFQTSLGAISGRVTQGGAGVVLASVTALSPAGLAVSALTGPDGAYRIAGLPPASYQVYVQPLPPAQTGESSPGNIVLPLDPDRRPIQPSAAFETQFFPNARELSGAGAIPVTAGSTVENVNFSVTARREPMRLYNVSTFGFPAQVAVRPAPINVNGTRNFFVATGQGLLTAANQPVTGLRASVAGGATTVTAIGTYSPGYLRFDLGFSPDSGEGGRHLVLSTAAETYIQPNAFRLTARQPPAITELARAGDGSVTILGSNIDSRTAILFDGVRALPQTAEEGRLTVIPPPGANSHRAAVVAINPDGQSSLSVQGDSPSTYLYDNPDSPSFALSPNAIAPGTETVVEVTGTGTAFQEGWTALQFSSPHIAVKRSWVLSPTRLLAQIAISPSASGAVAATVTSGLRSATIPNALVLGAEISSASPRLTVAPLAVNPLNGIAFGAPGGQVVFLFPGGIPQVSLAGRTVDVAALGDGIYSVRVPADFPTGPAILRVSQGGNAAVPIVVQIQEAGRIALEAGRTFAAGDTVELAVIGFSELASLLTRPRVTVVVAGVEHPARIVSGTSIEFVLLPSVPAGTQTISVIVDGRPSLGTSITLR
jgi:hypothetical protein